MKVDLFLGVDGGQSSTEAVIGDGSGTVLGLGTAGPCNHVSDAEAVRRFESAIAGAVSTACVQAGVAFADVVFKSACLGLSGGPEDKAKHVQRIIRAEHVEITHDAEIALWGALDGTPGVIVIAGTGSIAYGRNGAGTTGRAGGWGYLFGDEGGAWDIVRRAVRSALAMEEGWGPNTSLHSRLLAQTGAATANDMLHQFYTAEYPRSRVAEFAPVVDSAGVAGDGVAVGILAAAAGELAKYALAVHKTVFGDAPAAVSYTGGVFSSNLLCAGFTRTVERSGVCQVQPPSRSPAEGALQRALRFS